MCIEVIVCYISVVFLDTVYISMPTELDISSLAVIPSTHFTIPRRVEGCVDLGTAGRVQQPMPKITINILTAISVAQADFLLECGQS